MNAIDTSIRPATIQHDGATWQDGEIKWFDEYGKRIGFIIPDHGDSDVFFSWQVLRKYEIKESRVQEGVRVRFKSVPPERPGRRPRAVEIRIVA
mgnify:CR=1 FL=1